MVKNHIKRIGAPRRWDIYRKKYAFISRPNPGRDLTLSISLNTVLKELLKKTKTTKESKHLIKSQGILINGKRYYDEKFPVGFLDVITFPLIKEHYRLLISVKSKIFMVKISEEEAKLKLSKVFSKNQLSKEVTQINCSDGRNFLLKKGDPYLRQVNTNDCLLYSLPDQKIKQVLKLDKGSLVYLYKGKHTGDVVVVDEFDRDNIVFKIGKDVFETKKAYAFVVGKDKPVITVARKK